MNRCEYDILNNLQKDKKYIEYSMDDMYAYSSIGLSRKKQEDGVLIATHNKNSEFKLVAIADGMGKDKGALASNLVLYNLINWFRNVSLSYYSEKENIYKPLIPLLYKTDDEIRNRYNCAGTTIALAIKCINRTYTLNIGDTRIYLNNNFKLHQISRDHNIAWDLFEKGEIKKKEDIRFHKKSNLLTARLGCEKKLMKISQYIVKNNDYDSLYLFSDGITDCLSDGVLESFTYEKPKKILIKALSTNSFNHNLGSDYYTKIDGGKDNSSIVVLNNKKW